jgi:hypothetical protein
VKRLLAFEHGRWPWPSAPANLRALVAALEKRREDVIEVQIDEMGGTWRFATTNFNAIGLFLEQMVGDRELVRWREVRDGMVGRARLPRWTGRSALSPG